MGASNSKYLSTRVSEFEMEKKLCLREKVLLSLEEARHVKDNPSEGLVVRSLAFMDQGKGSLESKEMGQYLVGHMWRGIQSKKDKLSSLREHLRSIRFRVFGCRLSGEVGEDKPVSWTYVIRMSVVMILNGFGFSIKDLNFLKESFSFKLAKGTVFSLHEDLYMTLEAYLLHRMGVPLSREENSALHVCMRYLFEPVKEDWVQIYRVMFSVYGKFALYLLSVPPGEEKEKHPESFEYLHGLGIGHGAAAPMAIQNPCLKRLIFLDAGAARLYLELFCDSVLVTRTLEKNLLEASFSWGKRSQGVAETTTVTGCDGYEDAESASELSVNLLEEYLKVRKPSKKQKQVLTSLTSEQAMIRLAALTEFAGLLGEPCRPQVIAECKLLAQKLDDGTPELSNESRDKLIAFFKNEDMQAFRQKMPETLVNAALDACGFEESSGGEATPLREPVRPVKEKPQQLLETAFTAKKSRDAEDVGGTKQRGTPGPGPGSLPSPDAPPGLGKCDSCPFAEAVALAYCSKHDRSKQGRHGRHRLCQKCFDTCTSKPPQRPFPCGYPVSDGAGSSEPCGSYLAGAYYRENVGPTKFTNYQPTAPPAPPVPARPAPQAAPEPALPPPQHTPPESPSGRSKKSHGNNARPNVMRGRKNAKKKENKKTKEEQKEHEAIADFRKNPKAQIKIPSKSSSAQLQKIDTRDVVAEGGERASPSTLIPKKKEVEKDESHTSQNEGEAISEKERVAKEVKKWFT